MKELSRTQLQTKENFLNAYEKVRAEKALHTISIRDITDAAGYNRSSFYLYFKDIYDLAEAAEDRLINEMKTDSSNMELNFDTQLTGSFMQQLADSAFTRVDRILLFSEQETFRRKFLLLIQPVFSRVIGFPQAHQDFDFITSLILSIMLHNLRYWSAHPDASFLHLTDITHHLIAPGLNALSDR